VLLAELRVFVVVINADSGGARDTADNEVIDTPISSLICPDSRFDDSRPFCANAPTKTAAYQIEHH